MAFLGASRGLGRSVALEFFSRKACGQALLAARNTGNLERLNQEMGCANEILTVDFAQKHGVEEAVDRLRAANVQRVFYFAAGGPYGDFAKKKWKDHRWALQVSFLSPAELLHSIMSDPWPALTQVVFVGSAIADSSADPSASSYAAAKHGLKGLISTVIAEKPELDIRLFRPGYMDTDLLPKNSHPRLDETSLLSAENAAKIFTDWALDPAGSKIFTVEP